MSGRWGRYTCHGFQWWPRGFQTHNLYNIPCLLPDAPWWLTSISVLHITQKSTMGKIEGMAISPGNFLWTSEVHGFDFFDKVGLPLSSLQLQTWAVEGEARGRGKFDNMIGQTLWLIERKEMRWHTLDYSTTRDSQGTVAEWWEHGTPNACRLAGLHVQ